jgi:leucyl-tRNA synthetase
MEYNFREIEKKWQHFWAEHKTFRAENPPIAIGTSKPKYYVLDMFPYPSGAGLHVGHPLGYIASDIFARYKRLKGFNVLHPMGYDSFGLPAEQYAIQTGQHPGITTKTNIERYRGQMDKIGFSFDWEREVRTSDPSYYKWTQWIFIQLFNSWYNNKSNKAEKIESLITEFEKQGNASVQATCEETQLFTAENWKGYSEKEQSDILLNYRLAFLSDTMVNWCPQLGTVLANEEVKDGVSERGGYPVERKLMKQWSMRITAYADRLLKDLDGIDWSDSIKEAQRNWIGKSEGTSLKFKVQDSAFEIEVFTTRPDTIFGVSFVTLAPEHELVGKITTPDQKSAVEAYVDFAKSRSERDRMADVKKITGVFTGGYVLHPFTGKQIPIWIGDYVLAGYGTGAVMAVPGHDSRDYAFAKHFGLDIIEVVSGGDLSKESYDAKEGKLVNSDFLNGLEVKDAVKKAIALIEEKGLGKGKTNFRLRDAIFGRQRYWGEPIPVYYKDGIPHVLPENELPLLLPEVDKYLPTETGEPPLARANNWKYQGKYEYEYSTMPGWAGSSWYFLRYTDPHNDKTFASKEAIDYWQNVDLYIGGAEHATGHLLYVRFWTKFLNDLGLIPFIEPAKKLINQGMIQGVSAFVRILPTFIIATTAKDNKNPLISPNTIPPLYISEQSAQKLKDGDTATKNRFYEFLSKINKDLRTQANEGEIGRIDVSTKLSSLRHIPINYVNGEFVDVEHIKNKEQEYKDAIFFSDEDKKFRCIREVEKMSKSKWNVVSPDDMVEQYGADCLRLYEMFLGPLELSKPWNTNGITGVSNFIRKLWRLYHGQNQDARDKNQEGEDTFYVSSEAADKAELKTLHKTIKKIQEDIERFSFNTSVSNFMICVNELTELKCNKREILEPLAIILAPYAPHIAEELWSKLGHSESICYANFPPVKEEFLVDDAFAYPVSFNGKMRFKLELPLTLSAKEIENAAMDSDEVKKFLEGKTPKKVIIVPGKIINIVI